MPFPILLFLLFYLELGEESCKSYLNLVKDTKTVARVPKNIYSHERVIRVCVWFPTAPIFSPRLAILVTKHTFFYNNVLYIFTYQPSILDSFVEEIMTFCGVNFAKVCASFLYTLRSFRFVHTVDVTQLWKLYSPRNKYHCSLSRKIKILPTLLLETTHPLPHNTQIHVRIVLH